MLGYELLCDSCLGGNYNFYIAPKTDVLGYTVNSSAAGDVVDSLTMATGKKFVKVDFVEDGLGFKEPFETLDNGAKIYKPQYEIDLGCRTVAQKTFIDQLGGCSRYVIIHQERASGQCWINGHAVEDAPLRLLSGSSDTGKAIADKNSTTLIFGHSKGKLLAAEPFVGISAIPL